MTLTLIERILLISAEEDYLTLAQALLEMQPIEGNEAHQLASKAIERLLNDGLIYAAELVASPSSGRREVRRLDLDEAIATLSQLDRWQQSNLNDVPYIAFGATDAALDAFTKP